MRFACIVTLGLGFLMSSPALTAQASEPKVDQIFATYNRAELPAPGLPRRNPFDK